MLELFNEREALQSLVSQRQLTFLSFSRQDVTRGIDTSLTLKLQKRLTELEQEKQSLRDELENKEEQFQRARARVLKPRTFTQAWMRRVRCLRCCCFSFAAVPLHRLVFLCLPG